jgi:hypothetical protein
VSDLGDEKTSVYLDKHESVEVSPAFFMKFESLGGSGHGCEFGLVQRHYGAEPLSLLRWADIGIDCLCEALERRFDGVGDLEYTEIFPHDHQEYWTRDKRFHMAMRTFVKTSDIEPELMAVKVSGRLKFLKEKLVNDLISSEKIFVYRNMFRNLTDQELARLSAALSSYGTNFLLYIRYASVDHPGGTVIKAGPRLIIGYIDRFAFSPENEHLGPSDHLFLTVCVAAVAIVDQSYSEAKDIGG